MSTDDVAVNASPVVDQDTEPPSWLTSTFIQNAAIDKFTVGNLEVQDAVEAGENYATVVYRALAQSSLGPISFIIKCIPENEFRAKFLRESNMMTRELDMYTTTLPLLRGTLKNPNYPHCVYTQNDEAIVLRDLGPFGYRTSPRQLGLDVAHCRLALKELAHLHGLSAALRIQEPDIFKSKIQDVYKDTMYSEENRENTDKFLQAVLPSISEAVKNNLSFRFTDIAKIMDRMILTAYEDLKNDVHEAYLPETQDTLNERVLVLNHGDFWSNNMLFQYDVGSDTPVACAMIDFQMARYASPSLDLLYFLYSSTSQATRRAHMDELLQLYLDEANKALQSKGVKKAGKKFYKSVTEIKKDMQRHLNFGFIFCCVVLPAVIADKSAAPDLNEMEDDNFLIQGENPFVKMYSGPLFITRFTELLEDFDDLGYFENRIKIGK